MASPRPPSPTSVCPSAPVWPARSVDLARRAPRCRSSHKAFRDPPFPAGPRSIAPRPATRAVWPRRANRIKDCRLLPAPPRRSDLTTACMRRLAWLWLGALGGGCVHHLEEETSTVGEVTRDCWVRASPSRSVPRRVPDGSLFVWGAARDVVTDAIVLRGPAERQPFPSTRREPRRDHAARDRGFVHEGTGTSSTSAASSTRGSAWSHPASSPASAKRSPCHRRRACSIRVGSSTVIEPWSTAVARSPRSPVRASSTARRSIA